MKPKIDGHAADAETQWFLSGYTDDGATLEEIPFRDPVITVGRHSDNVLTIPNPTVSSRHAELRRTGTKLTVVDLDSTNGTFVNGNRVFREMELLDADVLQFGTAIYKVRAGGCAPANVTVATDASDAALGHVPFDQLLDDRAVHPHFQPIVRIEDSQCVGYEILARSSLVGLTTPDDMFRVASERSMAPHLSELLRTEGVRIGRHLKTTLYLNTHPAEVGQPKLFESLVRLRQDHPNTSLILEIHESAAASSRSMASLRQQLNELNIGLAYDDFGVGQARLCELAESPPDIVKFDIRFIRGLDEATEKHRQLLQSLVRAVRGLNVTPLAEGVETKTEADVCRELEFELAQGFYFGRPSPIEPGLSVEQSFDCVASALRQASP